ncbi:MAG TPA: helix-turn-helix transcriptional regulator [Bacteroidia bacterium]|jgi:DNA-binding XRE family transcriptional regulator|nr:helix-turn-helix transcriptional regulator [Bacteroidia bacterium]
MVKTTSIHKNLIIIGKRLRKLRESRGMSQEELGLSIGPYQSTIIRIEHGKSDAKLSTLIEIARY